MSLLSKIIRTGQAVPAHTVKDTFMHMSEEMGEIAVAIHRPHKADEPVFNELCDLFICVVDAMAVELDPHRTLTPEKREALLLKRMKKVLDPKCDKWHTVKTET